MSEMDEDDVFDDGSDVEIMSDDSVQDLESDDDLDVFAPVVSDKDRKRDYEVECSSHTINDIKKQQDKEVQYVAGMLSTQPQHAATLLRFFKWNREKLIDKYFADPDKVLSDAGVIIDAKKQPKFKKAPKDWSCDVCAGGEDEDTLALNCGHRFCRDCYTTYLTVKIKDEGESRRIMCMASDCTLIVDEDTVKMVVDPKVYETYQSLLLKTYVDDSDYLRWCPHPGCETAVECHAAKQPLKIVPTVTCNTCHNKFCFSCGLGDHQPCICPLTKKWLKKCQDDSETANWISANTKECSKCQSTIEKNGGCNHMTCKRCKYEFCWICQGPWSEHGTAWYNCNRYDEKSSTDARDYQAKSRAALERYLHYYNRYANHEQSARLDKELYAKTEKKMEEAQNNTDFSWIEVQFLKSALEVVVSCRTTLRWTYAFAYYLQRDNATHLFEDNQRDLEMAVEQLSELLEKPLEPEKIQELKQQVTDKSVYCAKRREILLEDTARGLLEGRWQYTTELTGQL